MSSEIETDAVVINNYGKTKNEEEEERGGGDNGEKVKEANSYVNVEQNNHFDVAFNAKSEVVRLKEDDEDVEVAASISTASTNRTFLYIAACTGNLAAFTCGIAFGWTSPEIPLLKQSDSPIGGILSQTQESWIGSLLPVGASIGPFIAGIAADKIGRKKTLLAGILPFLIAFALAGFGTNVTSFLAMRFLCGLGVGFIFTVLPMYIGEISDDEVRGSLGSFMQLFITVGLLFSFVLGPFISIKTFNVICLASPIAFFTLFLMFIPESPYYLIQSGQEKAAETSLMKIRKQTKSEIQNELNDIKISVEEALANKASFMDIFKSRGLTKALIISLSLVSFQQFSGINIVLFFAQEIFTDAGSTIPPATATIIIGVVQVLASSVTPVLVEKKGKKKLLLFSAGGMAISLGILAIFFYLKNGGKNVSSISWLPITCLVFYIITYCLGFGPLPWAVMGELFPGNIKSAASTATTFVCWILGFLITNYFALVAGFIGKSGSFGVFSICCVVAGWFVQQYVLETTGKSVKQIQDILGGN